jgi:predicted amidophosphoribosyltransferase
MRRRRASTCRGPVRAADIPRSRVNRAVSGVEHGRRSLVSCRSAYNHSGAVRNAVHKLKYGNERGRAEWCALELCRLVDESITNSAVLVPVPLHPARFAVRGYNQSLEICRWIAGYRDLEVREALLRIRMTRPQVGLDAAARRSNLLDAFAAREPVAGLDVILVDDVITTGSTVVAASAALDLAGARSVRAVTVATGV